MHSLARGRTAGYGGEEGGRTQSSSVGNEAGEEDGREEGGGGPTWESVVCGPPNQKSVVEEVG